VVQNRNLHKGPLLTVIAAGVQGKYTQRMAQSPGRLRTVFFWCLPTYAAVVSAILLALVQTKLPFRVQLFTFEAWAFVALFLPLSTIVAGVKAARLFHPTNRVVLHVVVACCFVVVALVMNVLCYRVIADVLR
jgi:hypothetical protein